MSQIQFGRKRKISDYQSSNTNAASTMPSAKEDREDLSWVMCVLMMATRQLALVNKTGQVNFEINVICRAFVEWVRNIVQQHFMSFFSAMLFLSYDRVIAGYLTRQVATTFMATCARHYSERDSVADANTQILLDMESAPVTLQTCNLAICNAITHMADTNLILVNQLIRDKLQTPVVPVDFIVAILGEGPLDMSCSNYEAVFSWLSQIVQNRQHETECIMGYISVAKLGTQEDYVCKEAYLESYFGVAKSNFYTYFTAVRECAGKTFDLSNFLSLEYSMLDFTRFMSRMGVGGDGMLQGYQQNPILENQRTTYLFTQSAQDSGSQSAPQAQPQGQQQAQQPAQRYGISRCWVNVIQHLLVTSIQGNRDLHADNMFTFGANLTEFILSRCAPIQSIPAGVSIYESYHHVHEEVVPMHMQASKRPEYFVRTINDHCALETGFASELPAVLGVHPPEDVMHLGSWIQLYSILFNGEKPDYFQPFPSYNGRPPELVLGRRYPILGAHSSGTLLLTDAAHITITDENEDWQAMPPVPLKDWWNVLCGLEAMTTPLVFRHHAAFLGAGVNRPPLVAIPHDDGQFVNNMGEYLLAQASDSIEPMDFSAAHGRLLPIGAHILVKTASLHSFKITSNTEYVLGCLRYPNEDTENQSDKCQIFVTIRMKDVPGHDTVVRVVGVPPLECIVPDPDATRRTMHSYTTSAIPM